MRKTIFYISLGFFIISLFLVVFFFIKIKEENHYLDDLINNSVIKRKITNPEETILALSKEIYRKTNKGLIKDNLDWFSQIESISFFNMTAAVSLKYGGFGIEGHAVFGPCGTMSRTLLNALWRLNIPARKLQLLNNALGKGGVHTMIEFYYNGHWRVLSPSDNTFVWRNRNGEIATADEIQNDKKIFSQIYTEKPAYPYLFDNYANIRWEKLHKSLVSLIRIILGEKTFKSAQTPKLYDQPRNVFFFASISLSFFFALLGFIFRPKDK